MKIAPNLQFAVIEPTKKSLEAFVRMIRSVYQNFTTAFNGNIGFGDGTNLDNINGSWINVVAPVAPDTDFTVNHNLGRIPSGYWIMQKDRACDIYTGSIAATATQLTLRANVASAVLRIFVICILINLGFFAKRSEAQGVHHQEIALKATVAAGSSGLSGSVMQPIPSAIITVCNGSVLPITGSTCTGLASIFSDAALTLALSNPFNADLNGNYGFWTSPGSYIISVGGANITTYSYAITLACGVSSVCAYTGPMSFTGTVSHSGTEMFKNINSRLYITSANGTVSDQGWPGSDPCAWITAAEAALPVTGGIVDATGLQGGQTACASSFTIGGLNNKPVTLLLDGAVISVPNTITLNGGSLLIGHGSNSNGPFPTRIIANPATFPSNTTLLQFDNTQINFDIRIVGFELDCSNVTGCRGIDTGDLQDGGKIEDVWVLNYKAATGGCLNTGVAAPTENWQATSLSCVRSTSAVVTGGDISLNALGDHFIFHTGGCGTSAGSTSNACIQVNNSNLVISGYHAENATDGILFTGNAAAGGTSFVGEINCLNNVTNCIHFSSNFNGSATIGAIKKNSATTAVKNDNATINDSCNDENAGWYFFSGVNANPQRLTSCSNLPNFVSNNPTIPPNGTGFVIQDNTPAHVQKVGVGPNVTGNDQVGFYNYTGSKVEFYCQLLSPFGCFAGNGALSEVANGTTAQTVGNVIPLMCVTSQKTESAADANVLTCTPPATAGSYRLRIASSISAASAATLGWTATWTDSNGNAATPTNLPVCLASTGACAATTGALSAVDRFSGEFQIDVNNAATAIGIKLKFSGTSFTAKVSATVERII